MSRQPASLLVLMCVLVVFSGCAAPATPPVPAAPDFASALESLSNADNALVAINPPAPCCPKQNLPQFLGVECLAKGVVGLFNGIRNRLGQRFPGLEAKPPLLAITDPANMSEDAPPAVQAAAGVKAEEDKAAQKIKALRYLATIGCGGCYPEVEDAFIKGMEDCTEEVRYEAVLAIRKTTGVNCCYCSCDACCTEKIQKKLRELSEGTPCPCCTGEQSARVRRQARLALQACGPPVVFEEPEEPEPIAPPPGPKEGPSEGAQGDEEGAAEGEGEEDDDKDKELVDEVVEATDRSPSIRPTPNVRPIGRVAPPSANSSNLQRRITSSPEPLPPVSAT